MPFTNYTKTDKVVFITSAVLLSSIGTYTLINSMNDFNINIQLNKQFFALSGSLLVAGIISKLLNK